MCFVHSILDKQSRRMRSLNPVFLVNEDLAYYVIKSQKNIKTIHLEFA